MLDCIVWTITYFVTVKELEQHKDNLEIKTVHIYLPNCYFLAGIISYSHLTLYHNLAQYSSGGNRHYNTTETCATLHSNIK